jgi:hypothetical protein
VSAKRLAQFSQLPRAIRGPREDTDRRQRAEQTAKRIRIAAEFRSEAHGVGGTPGQDVGTTELCGNLDHARAMSCRDHRAHRKCSHGSCSAHAALA